MSLRALREGAPSLYEALNGLFCLYKPAGQSMKQITYGIQSRLADELNALPNRPLKQCVKYQEENIGTDLPIVTTVPNLSDHPLVMGPRFVREDFRLTWSSTLGKHSSGVVAMGIGRKGHYLTKALAQSHQLRVYHVKGELGRSTQSFTPHGRTVERTTYHHVTHGKMDKMISAMQSGHQRHMFAAAKVEPQSEEAYELASRGMLRPAERYTGPVIYGMKCVHFHPPDFTLEVHSVSEGCGDLAALVHQLGLRLRASAVCVQRRRVRYGRFTLQHAMLTKHCSAHGILDNITYCQPLAQQIQKEEQKTLQALEAEQTGYLDSNDMYIDDNPEDYSHDLIVSRT